MAKVLTMQDILDAKDITEKEIPIEEWGGSVVVRSISYRALGKIREKVAGDGEFNENDPDFEKMVLSAGMISPSVTVEDAEHIIDKSYGAVVKILTAIMDKSNATESSVKEEERNFRPEQ